MAKSGTLTSPFKVTVAAFGQVFGPEHHRHKDRQPGQCLQSLALPQNPLIEHFDFSMGKSGLMPFAVQALGRRPWSGLWP